MSKIKLEAPFMGFRGKICKHSNIIYKKLRQTNFTSQICNPRTKPFSEAELARQTKFRQATAAVKAVYADAGQRATAESEFAAQSKYQSLYGYLLAREYAKLNVEP